MRKISVFKAEKIKQKNYPHIQSNILVERTGLRGNKKSEETLYYISSKVLPSKKIAAKIRGHWLIEDQVHSVKDVIFNEDKSKIRELQAARNLSLLYTIIMNVYRSFGFDSIKQGIYWLGNNWDKILACST